MDDEMKSGPLYSMIYDKLRADIAERKYRPGQKLPTELELAKAFGVSRITSKRALEELERSGFIYRQRGRGSFVSDLQAANHHMPQGIDANRVVPIILPSEGHGMFGYVQGASEVLNRSGYFLKIYTTNGTAPAERILLKQLLQSDVKTLLYYPTDDRNLDMLLALHFSHRHVITIDKRLDGLPTTSVLSDNRTGGQMVTEMLLNQGHRRIAYLASVGLEAVPSVRERFIGYCTALRGRHIPIDPSIVSFDFVPVNEWDKHRPQAISQLKQLLEAGVTAVQTEHDFVAREVVMCAAELGVSIPRDLSIVGFDNSELSSHLQVALTTVQQDFYEIGKRSAEVAAACLTDNVAPPVESIVVPVCLVERASVTHPVNVAAPSA